MSQHDGFLHLTTCISGKPVALPSYLEALEGKYLEGREVRGPALQTVGWLDDSNWTGGGSDFNKDITKISSEYPQKSRVRPFVGNSRFDIRRFYINLMDALLQLSHLFFVVCIIPWNRLKSHVLLLKVTLYCFTVGEQNAPARLIRPRFLTFVGIPGPMMWTASGMNSRVTPFTVMWFYHVSATVAVMKTTMAWPSSNLWCDCVWGLQAFHKDMAEIMMAEVCDRQHNRLFF